MEPVNQQNRQTVRRSAFFVNSALKIHYHIVKNTLPQTAFSEILPTGKSLVAIYMHNFCSCWIL